MLHCQKSNEYIHHIHIVQDYIENHVYSRAFKNYYNVSPIYYRNNYSKNCKEPFKIS